MPACRDIEQQSNIEDIFYSVVSQSKILSLILSMKEKIFPFVSISLCKNNRDKLYRVSFCSTSYG